MENMVAEDGELYICVEFLDDYGVEEINDDSGIADSTYIHQLMADFAGVAPKFTVYKLVKVFDVNDRKD